MSSIKCPYCGYRNGDLYEYGLDDGQTTTIQCEHCDRKLTLSCDMEITYTVFIPDGEPHPEDLETQP